MPYRRYLLIVLVLLWGCSTKKNTWLSRNYHALTAHYNVYFNGNESYKAGIKAIRESYKDNFNKVLPMFEESDEQAVSLASSNMDRAIEKGTKLIVRHSITARPKKKPGKPKKDFYNKKEYNKWVDDALLLIGKAQVVKHDFRQAIRTFDLLINDFPNDKNKYNALIWKARAYTELGDFNNARIALEIYDMDGKAPESLYGKYMEVYANLLLKQGKYKDAIPYLKNSIEGIKDHDDKARYSFILAQIEEQSGDKDAAANAYAMTLKYKPNYEMAFNARLRRAAIVYRDASIDEIMKQIKKMLRDKKNEEFQDQIFYALGKVYLNFDNEEEAINSFRTSADVSVNNDYQKALSYLSIADIFFKNEEFKPAYQYYDSTLTVMAEDYKSYEEIKERHYTLQMLVEQLDIINREDSLIAIADMSKDERNDFIDKIITDAKVEMEIAMKNQRKQEGNTMFYGGGGSYRNTAPPGGQGKWYFYNVATNEMGKQEFKRIWGNRKLEDNWRRINKGISDQGSSIPEEPGMPGEPGGTDAPGVPADSLSSKQTAEQQGQTGSKQQSKIPTKDELLADIPLTKEAYSKALLTRDISRYEAGMIFLDQLKNYPRAIEMFEACIHSKEIHEEDMEKVYIALYRAYDANGDRINRLRTLSMLKEKFPSSKFIQYLEDPDYLAKIKAASKKVDDEYSATYAEYLNGNYEAVINKANEIELNDTVNIYLPNYRLIKALSFAREGNAEKFKQELEVITTKNAGTQQAELATALLKQLSEGRTPVKSDKPYQSLLRARIEEMTKESEEPEKNAKPDISGFKYAPNEKQNFIALPPAGADINRIIFNMADFNFSRYLLNDYGIETTRLPDNSPVILIRGFNNKLEGMDYFYALREHENKIFLSSDSVKTKLFVISDSNLKFFLSSGQINNYDAFFKEYYLKSVDLKDVPEEMRAKQTQEKSQAEAAGTAVVAADTTMTAVQPEEKAPAPKVWTEDKAAQQDVMVVFEKRRMDYKKMLKIYTNYTKNNYAKDSLKIDLNDFIEGYKSITVSGFRTIKQADTYRNALLDNPMLLRNIQRGEHYLWIITPDNKQKLSENKDLKGYDEFFKEYYSRPEVLEYVPVEPVKKTTPVEAQAKEAAAATATVTTATGIVADTTKVTEQTVQQPVVITPPKPEWIENKKAPQDVMVVFEKGRADYNKMLKIYTNYTKNNYAKDSLKVELNDFIEGYKSITVSGFRTIKQADTYINALLDNPMLLRNIRGVEHYLWIITPQNREKLSKNKDLKNYDEFFKEYYSRPEVLNYVPAEPVKEAEPIQEKPKQVKEKQVPVTQNETQVKEAVAATAAVTATEVVADTTKATEQTTQQPEVVTPPRPEWIENKEAPQDVMLIFEKGRADYNKMMKIYTNYTKNNYAKDSLNVELNDFVEGYKSITVSGFRTIKQADTYINALLDNPMLLRNIQGVEHYLWIITPDNRQKLSENKDLKSYDEFFKEYYSRPEILNYVPAEPVKKAESAGKQITEDQIQKEQNITEKQKEESKAIEPAKQEEVKTKTVDTTKTVIKTIEEPSPQIQETVSTPEWITDKSAPQDVIVVFVKSRIDYNKMLKIYSNYTKNNFTKDSLKVEMTDFVEGYKSIYISGFKDLTQAMKYRNTIKANSLLLRDIQRRKYYIWLITKENREILLQSKDLEGYDEFFKKEYLRE